MTYSLLNSIDGCRIGHFLTVITLNGPADTQFDTLLITGLLGVGEYPTCHFTDHKQQQENKKLLKRKEKVNESATVIA